jgi:hypothetical protein
VERPSIPPRHEFRLGHVSSVYSVLREHIDERTDLRLNLGDAFEN